MASLVCAEVHSRRTSQQLAPAIEGALSARRDHGRRCLTASDIFSAFKHADRLPRKEEDQASICNRVVLLPQVAMFVVLPSVCFPAK